MNPQFPSVAPVVTSGGATGAVPFRRFRDGSTVPRRLRGGRRRGNLVSHLQSSVGLGNSCDCLLQSNASCLFSWEARNVASAHALHQLTTRHHPIAALPGTTLETCKGRARKAQQLFTKGNVRSVTTRNWAAVVFPNFCFSKPIVHIDTAAQLVSQFLVPPPRHQRSILFEDRHDRCACLRLMQLLALWRYSTARQWRQLQQNPLPLLVDSKSPSRVRRHVCHAWGATSETHSHCSSSTLAELIRVQRAT